MQNMEKDRCMGSIFRNQFRFLLMYWTKDSLAESIHTIKSVPWKTLLLLMHAIVEHGPLMQAPKQPLNQAFK